jgi:hypothetical protein
MNRTDRAYLDKLKSHATETRTFLGNTMKPERERSVCRAFLRTIGIPFSDGELIAPSVEPADVAFRDARFQVRDLLRHRKRGEIWKKKERRYGEAKSLRDLREPYSPPVRTSLEVLVPEVTTALAEKAAKYGTGCKDLDALVYVDLSDTYLEANSSLTDTAQLQSQRWRSVSLLFVPYGVVLLADVRAPAFLRAAGKEAHMRWPNMDTLFEAQP